VPIVYAIVSFNFDLNITWTTFRQTDRHTAMCNARCYREGCIIKHGYLRCAYKYETAANE